ncbi:unnamed protein product [Leuciscus chuanchicus]
MSVFCLKEEGFILEAVVGKGQLSELFPDNLSARLILSLLLQYLPPSFICSSLQYITLSSDSHTLSRLKPVTFTYVPHFRTPLFLSPACCRNVSPRCMTPRESFILCLVCFGGKPAGVVLALRVRNRANGLVPDATSHSRVRVPGHKTRRGFHYQKIPASVFRLTHVSVQRSAKRWVEMF